MKWHEHLLIWLLAFLLVGCAPGYVEVATVYIPDGMVYSVPAYDVIAGVKSAFQFAADTMVLVSPNREFVAVWQQNGNWAWAALTTHNTEALQVGGNIANGKTAAEFVEFLLLDDWDFAQRWEIPTALYKALETAGTTLAIATTSLPSLMVGTVPYKMLTPEYYLETEEVIQ